MEKIANKLDHTHTSYATLNEQLHESLARNQNGVFGRVGKCNDKTLGLLIDEIRKESTCLDNFICFTKTLDALYSTHLRTNEKQNFNETIITTANVLQQNWNGGSMLKEVNPHSLVQPTKVDLLLVEMNLKLNNQYISFATKTLHLLNDNYPIIDSRVKKFFKTELTPSLFDFKAPVIIYADFNLAFQSLIHKLGWNKGVGMLDIAIWQFEGEKESKRDRKAGRNL